MTDPSASSWILRSGGRNSHEIKIVESSVGDLAQRSLRLSQSLSLLFVLAIFGSLPLFGQAPPSQLYSRSWTMRDGVPNNITSIASLNGFLWIGTDDGLYMFDGNTFERYKAPEGERLESEQIIFVGAAGDGSLWLSYLFGGITRLKDGHLTNFTQDEGLRAGQTTSLVEDRNGAL